jgi:hypothetical protein
MLMIDDEECSIEALSPLPQMPMSCQVDAKVTDALPKGPHNQLNNACLGAGGGAPVLPGGTLVHLSNNKEYSQLEMFQIQAACGLTDVQ